MTDRQRADKVSDAVNALGEGDGGMLLHFFSAQYVSILKECLCVMLPDCGLPVPPEAL